MLVVELSVTNEDKVCDADIVEWNEIERVIVSSHYHDDYFLILTSGMMIRKDIQ